MSDPIYRYSSTMGSRYAMPIYFSNPVDARSHERMCKRLIGNLPGQDSMRIETFNGTDWVEFS